MREQVEPTQAVPVEFDSERGHFKIEMGCLWVRSETGVFFNLQLKGQYLTLLHMLVLASGAVVTREEITAAYWRPDHVPESAASAIDGSVSVLRKVIGQNSIATVRGTRAKSGYKFTCASQVHGFEVRVLERVVYYEYLDRYHLVHRKQVTAEALVEGVGHITDRFGWTGHGKVTGKSKIPTQEYVPTDTDLWQWYRVMFQHQLKKGEQVRTDVEWDLVVDGKEPEPFLAATILEPTDKLVLQLKISPKLGVRFVWLEEYLFAGAPSFLSVPRAFELDRDGSVQVTLPDETLRLPAPQARRRYKLRWNFLWGRE